MGKDQDWVGSWRESMVSARIFAMALGREKLVRESKSTYRGVGLKERGSDAGETCKGIDGGIERYVGQTEDWALPSSHVIALL